jgi:hypothetical protein
MTSDNASLRLGDLLTSAGMLNLEQLREAIEIAKQQSLPVGRVLIMSGYLTELQLQAAVKLQSMAKDGVVDFESVMQALAIVAKEPVDAEEALMSLGLRKQESIRTNKLGELLVSAGIVSAEQLSHGLIQSEQSGLPLGRVLVHIGFISEQLLSAALSAQVLVRDKKVTREQAIAGLIACRERQIPIEQHLSDVGQLQLPSRPGVRLGQLLVMAGLLDEENLIGAIEMGLVKEQSLGKTLLSLNLITEENLAKSLEAQALVMSGMDVDEAANILTTAVAKDSTVSHAASLLLGTKGSVKAEPEAPPLPLYQFLQLAGLMGPKELEQAVRVGTQDTDIMARMLQKARILEPRVIEAAVACADLVAKRVLTTEQAIMALTHSKLTKASIFDSFDEFGWSQPPEHQSESSYIEVPSRPVPATHETSPEPEKTKSASPFEGEAAKARGISQVQIDGISTGDFRPIGPSVFEQAVRAASLPEGQVAKQSIDADQPTNKHAPNLGQLYPQNTLSATVDAWAAEPPQKHDRQQDGLEETTGAHVIGQAESGNSEIDIDGYRHMLDGPDETDEDKNKANKKDPKPRKRLIDLIP